MNRDRRDKPGDDGGMLCLVLVRRQIKDALYFPSASPISPIEPMITRHQANSEKPWRVT
jgi:hypothetical protein